MFSRILLLVADAGTNQTVACRAIDLAEHFGARIFVLSVTEPTRKKKLASMTKREVGVVAMELEESAWQSLYIVEDLAFDKEVKTSLHYEEGAVYETVIEFLKNYDIDLLVMGHGEVARKFAAASPVPVFTI
jgi:nucleotide-binding universal stress UspA family protein